FDGREHLFTVQREHREVAEALEPTGIELTTKSLQELVGGEADGPGRIAVETAPGGWLFAGEVEGPLALSRDVNVEHGLGPAREVIVFFDQRGNLGVEETGDGLDIPCTAEIFGGSLGFSCGLALALALALVFVFVFVFVF